MIIDIFMIVRSGVEKKAESREKPTLSLHCPRYGIYALLQQFGIRRHYIGENHKPKEFR